MADSKLLYLFEGDQDHYMKAYRALVSYSSKYERQETWTNTVLLDKIVPQLPNLDQDSELRVLGIGSGSGEVEFPFLSALQKKYSIISNRVVEPVEDQIVKYKALAQSKARELQGVKFDWRQQTLAQYRDTDGDGTKFHFISAIHSMYYVGDVDSSLMYVYDLLEPGGIMILILISDQKGMCEFWNHMPGSSQQGQRHRCNSADMRSAFDRRNIPYIQSQYTSDADISKCFDETSEDGNLLLDFLVQVSEFKKTATTSQYKEMMEYLASSSKKDGSKFFISDVWDAVIVTKLPGSANCP